MAPVPIGKEKNKDKGAEMGKLMCGLGR